MDNFWIIGGGKFGLRAVKALSKKHSLTNLTIVEKEKTVCRQLDRLGFEAVCMDGIQYLERNLASETYPDWTRLFVEGHLGGRVWFTSSEEQGTSFLVQIGNG